ncbi:unnamed protein product [Dovyalis caffra]|uniref:F-ATPase gamma subunit n=1 Tax=Dovyalis caffra TaxID=77055 RepID=A0AAV1QNY2_9ROSI|nr:unnamed protein product [Dovyalis caffra]
MAMATALRRGGRGLVSPQPFTAVRSSLITEEHVPLGVRSISTQVVRNRMKSVKNIQKITKAMKMVAASKLRLIQTKAENSRGLWQPFTALLGDTPSVDVKKNVIVTVSSDKGLCGGINSTAVKVSRAVSKVTSGPDKETKYVILGEKAKAQLIRDSKKNIAICMTELQKNPLNYTQVSVLADDILKNVEYDALRIVFNKFQSVVSFLPTMATILSPEVAERETESGGKLGDLDSYEIEGGETKGEILQNLTEFQFSCSSSATLINDYAILVHMRTDSTMQVLFNAVMENACSEQGARMSAMDSSSRNAGEMLDRLTLTYNRTRQASITTELTEIISGAAALEGNNIPGEKQSGFNYGILNDPIVAFAILTPHSKSTTIAHWDMESEANILKNEFCNLLLNNQRDSLQQQHNKSIILGSLFVLLNKSQTVKKPIPFCSPKVITSFALQRLLSNGERMDLWVVGAAAAAGYIAKYWQNLSRDRASSLELSSGTSTCEKPETANCPFHELTRGKKQAEDSFTNGRHFSDGGFSDTYRLDSASDTEAASTRGYGERLARLGTYDDCNVLSMSSLLPGFSVNENLKETEGGNGPSDDMGDKSGNLCTGEMDSFHVSGKKTSSLRTKRSYSHVVKPLSSLDSCLMAQLYKEHARMEEYVLSALPLPSTILRPLLITDGRQIISRADGDSIFAQIRNGNNRRHREEIVRGVPPLPKIGTSDLPKKIKSKTEKGRNERSSSSHNTSNGKHLQSPNGFHDGMVLFCLGVSIGIISSLIANGREVDQLKEVLKQTENLVQDLQEELDMKDSLTVKELANENIESQDTCDNSFHYRALNPHLLMQNVNDSMNNIGIESYNENAEQSSESRSKIEAELEAELERLGLNMNPSAPQIRLSDLVEGLGNGQLTTLVELTNFHDGDKWEVDQDSTADFAQGELRLDMVNGQAAAQSESNQDASGTSPAFSGNYIVSPRELSLRLYEVIQSTLEERVKELETALQKSQREVELMESEHKNVQRLLSTTELRYSSGEESPVAEGDFSCMDQPHVMNLSGEALDAYNEAYEELNKMNESEEEDSPSEVFENDHQVGLHLLDQSMLWGQNGRENGSFPCSSQNKEKTSNELHRSPLKTSADYGSRIEELLYVGVTEDENSDCDDDMEKQLIKQIVEKTKKGSPVVLNAQRVFSVDDNEH